jgi:uncharacterized membrane protein
VITNVLMPMIEEHGEQLQIIGIDISQAQGSELYQAAVDYYQIPDERRGVPALVVNDEVLVGSFEIPDQFPAIVEQGLAANGYDWPTLPGLSAVLEPVVEEKTPSPTEDTEADVTEEPSPTEESATAQPSAATVTGTPTQFVEEPTATPSSAAEDTLTPTLTPVPALTPTPGSAALDLSSGQTPDVETEEPPPDPVGFTIAGVVLVGMLLALGFSIVRVATASGQLFGQYADNPGNKADSWLIPVLALVGLVVAGYLAHVEITQTKAVCGPVGECNIVQASEYARILGVPIAVLGLLNYVAVLLLWVVHKQLPGAPARYVGLMLLAPGAFIMIGLFVWLENALLGDD